jgi:hypothetical protein
MARLLAERTGKPIETIGPLSVRPPIYPVTLGDIADETSETAAVRPVAQVPKVGSKA